MGIKIRNSLWWLIPIVILSLGLLIFYRSQSIISLAEGACSIINSENAQEIIRESDETAWCLSGVAQPVIDWQWSPDGELLAYAVADANNPERQLSGRWGYAKLPNYNWYLLDANGANHRRFRAPEPFGFSFSQDGQYATFPTYSDYGTTRVEVIHVRSEKLVCRYSSFNLWYSEEEPPCPAIQLKNGEIWDIRTETNRSACEYHVENWGWSEHLEQNGCRELLNLSENH